MRLVCIAVVHSVLVPKMYKSGNLIVLGYILCEIILWEADSEIRLNCNHVL